MKMGKKFRNKQEIVQQSLKKRADNTFEVPLSALENNGIETKAIQAWKEDVTRSLYLLRMLDFTLEAVSYNKFCPGPEKKDIKQLLQISKEYRKKIYSALPNGSVDIIKSMLNDDKLSDINILFDIVLPCPDIKTVNIAIKQWRDGLLNEQIEEQHKISEND